MSSKVTCKACGKVWLDRLDYLKNPGCNFEGCLSMTKRNNPPAILGPVKSMRAPAPDVHPTHCVCNRCMDARNAESDLIHSRLAETEAADDTVPFRDIVEDDGQDWDYSEDNMWTRRYESARNKYREQFVNKNNDVTQLEMKHPVPKRMKMRVIHRDSPVLDKYDPAEEAMYVNVPIAVGATIYPRG